MRIGRASFAMTTLGRPIMRSAKLTVTMLLVGLMAQAAWARGGDGTVVGKGPKPKPLATLQITNNVDGAVAVAIGGSTTTLAPLQSMPLYFSVGNKESVTATLVG